MNLREFSPYVLPFVIGCPMPVMIQHVRLAAIDFCRKTQCFKRDLVPKATDGTVILVMEPPAETQIRQVKAVTVGDRGDWPILGAPQGENFVRTKHPADFCFTPDNRNLHIYALQPSGTLVTVSAALAPTLLATDLEDALFNEYAQDIAEGAIASIKSVPGQGFTDLVGGPMHRANFQNRINVTSAKVGRGLADSKMRHFTTFI